MPPEILNAWMVILLAVNVVLWPRIFWFWTHGGLTQPEDWSPAERKLGRLASWGFAIAAIVSGATAAYVATRVPWVDNLPALLGRPAAVNGRPTMPESTALYLFSLPIGLGAFAAALTDPWAIGIVRFRGPRDLVLRALPLIGLVAAGYSVWHSIGAMAAAAQ